MESPGCGPALAGVTSHAIPVPPGVSVCRRIGGDREVYVITNFSARAQEIAFPSAMADVLHGGEVTVARFPRYGVAVLSRPTTPAKTKS